MTTTQTTPSENLGERMLADSPGTWTDYAAPAPVIDPLLETPRGDGPLTRWRKVWVRQGVRRATAQAHVADAFDPVRGLPVAQSRTVVSYIGGLLRSRMGLLIAVTVANAGAAAAALVVPRLLGDLVNTTQGTPGQRTVTALMTMVCVVIALQAMFTFFSKRTSAVVGHTVLAQAREYVIRAVLRLPLGKVESASTGDLVTRVTRDVGSMSDAVRWGLPEAIISLITVVLTIVAMFTNSWILAVPTMILISLSIFQIRSYLTHAPAGYLYMGSTYSRINSTLTETVEGARTVESMNAQGKRRGHGHDDLLIAGQGERYALTLRNVLFFVMDMVFSLPRVVTLLVGAIGYANGWLTLGQITTGMLYIETFYGPFGSLVGTIDHLQVGVASTTRLLGIAAVPADREEGQDRPEGRDLRGEGLHYAYRPGNDVLHGIDLDLRTGERLAIVGPSGSGKSTLGRLLSGIHGPRLGSVTVGGAELTQLPLDVLRREVALVTQEHHVFRGTVRDNIVLAREGSSDDTIIETLRTVDAWEWVSALPKGLDTMLGSGNQALTPAQSQQIALARLILADPHTIVLDEATSLIDPRTARHLEGSMNALLTGRTVVAIAHRLHTAHDADRIAVVQDGRIIELGSHDELMAADGEYASLWKAWTS